MSYGLPPACGSTSQPSQHRLPDANQGTTSESDLNPDALPFVPRDSGNKRSSHTPTGIRQRRTARHKAHSSQRPHPHPSQKKQSSEAAREKIDEAYDALKNQEFSDAEEKFQAILQEYPDELSRADYQNSVLGLARSLKEQTPEKQEKARTHLQKLRLNGPLTAFGASVIPNLDLTLSRCEEALGSRSDAEKRLVKLRNMNPDADEEILCQHSHNFDADITNARLWQSMEKHQMAETLLVNMKKELTRILLSNRCAATAKTLHKQLQIVNIALVRLLQERGLYEWAEDLLLDMSGKRANHSEEFLCQPCGNDEIDLAVLRLWELMCKHERVGRLLLNMSGKRLDGTEEDLFTPYGDRDIDLALARHWQRMGKYQWAERLLLNMSDKHLYDTEEDLCTPSGDREIDLALLRVWELQGKYKLTEKLLLNMINKHPDDDLCRPSEDFMIDLTLVRHWQIASKFKRSERLLLNMSGKDPNACAEDLCQPCGNFDIDLNQALLWQAMGKSEWSERLLLNMSGKHPEATEEFLCKPCGHPLIDLAMARLWELTGKYKRCERLLLNIIGKHPDNTEENLCKPSGTPDIDLTLVRLWRMMNKKERSLKLLHRCCDLYHASECEYTLLSIYAGTERFMEIMSGCQESANTLLTCSIHYFRLATGQITDNDLESGRNNLKKALESVESALQKYPATAGAYSQKAHCLRMLSYSEGNSEDVWTEWFEKAKVLDPSRKERFKDNDDWRITEALAVKKLQDMA